MGISIEDGIDYLSRSEAVGNMEEDRHHNEVLKTAISTMRKYQKIEQIIKDIPYGGDATVRRIQEVIEDGSENNHHASNT